jgi:hypothetical protein
MNRVVKTNFLTHARPYSQSEFIAVFSLVDAINLNFGIN